MVKIRNLGLAAYAKMHGARLVGMDGKLFVFESTKSVEEWELEYAMSDCARHDQEVMALRRLLG